MRIFFKLFFVVSICFAPVFLAAQDDFKWMAGINGGAIIYQGDLTPSSAGSYKTASPVVSFSIARILNPYFAVRGTAMVGKLKGDDAAYDKPVWRRYRALTFTTPVTEFSAQLVWNPFGNNHNGLGMKVTPYLFAGGGVNFINVNRNFSRLDTTVFGSATKTAAGLMQDTAITPPRSMLVLPAGAGLSFYISPRWSLNYEFGFRYTFTDYLDGFSYVANPNQKDYYHAHTLGLVYRFGGSGTNGSNPRLGCPVIRY